MNSTINTIKNRVSVRTYQREELSKEVLEQIQNYIEHIENPFGVPITFKILNAKEHNLSSPVILGADTYVGAKYKKGENAEVAFGYAFEDFVLYASSLGLGTVWLAATIGRKGFEEAMAVKEGEVMPVVSPIGYGAKERSIRENLMRKGMKSDERQPFPKLFFRNDFQHSLQESEAGQWLTPLKMVQLAPSATNKQPWRLVVEENKVHFYEEKTKGYANESTGDIQKVDLGIALYHFEVGAKEQGLKGSILQKNPGISTAENVEYIATYQLED